jgi:hypothetical protein
MPKWFAAFLVCFLPALAAADDAIIKDYTPADFEKFIKEDLKKDFQKAKIDVGFEYAIKNTGYSALFFVRPKFLLLQATLPKELFTDGKEVTMQKIHDWNVKAVYSRAYFVEDGRKVRYEGTLSFAAGVTPDQVRSFYTLLEQESASFLQHLGGIKMNKGGDGPKKDVKGKPREI